jgi:hypothetical protein
LFTSKTPNRIRNSPINPLVVGNPTLDRVIRKKIEA